ncbi:MAG TPA: extracellular solute-binding protein [Candidatus Eisenbergiella merdavium]|uniref:Extracellular solute-binding protein n=1 Tax=Candidatus Eisenbergiella merdavium TaxID=2838551 RepID=A0A9D2NIM4_9FIRM|nr:extracellular solute-binding protein [Candidatus Eisenbergiella merdavium]
MKMKKLLSFLLAAATLTLTACGSSTASTESASSSGDSGSAQEAQTAEDASAGDVDNGDGSYYNEALGYTYGTTFHSDEPITYTMFFNDNDAYPYKDSWAQDGGIFAEIAAATNVTLDITIVNNASYSDKVSLAISSGTAPYIIPKMYSETAYVTGGGIVPVSDYIQYMPNYTGMIETYDLQTEVDTLLQEDGKYYRLPGLKETALQDYALLVRSDLFEAAGHDVTELENDWTWDEFIDILVDVKAYMVEQGIVGENDYIWSDRWCGATSGYGQGGSLLNLIASSFGIYSGWGITSNSAGLYFDWDNDEFALSATSDSYKEYMSVVQRLVVDEKILDPETWTQDDDVADGKFYRGETALITTNRSQYTTQVEGLASQLGEGSFEVYEVVLPVGNNNYQAEKSRLECGVCISSGALDELGEDEFIRMMRFVDWLWYSEAGLTLTKWGVEGETYTVTDGVYALTDGYYCGGLSIPQSSDDQVDMRLEYGFACGNFMYSGSRELLTSNFSAELRDFYERMAEYRELQEVDPAIAMSEDDAEQANLWATPLKDTINTWTLKFAMGQADLEADWDTYVAEVEAQNAQSLVDLYNSYYKGTN